MSCRKKLPVDGLVYFLCEHPKSVTVQPFPGYFWSVQCSRFVCLFLFFLFFWMSFSCVSLNVRGLRDKSKRKHIFYFLKKHKFDICLLQETYSTPDVEKSWIKEWNGQIFFAHGTNHSCGVATLINRNSNLCISNMCQDDNGRFLICKLHVNGIFTRFAFQIFMLQIRLLNKVFILKMFPL